MSTVGQLLVAAGLLVALAAPPLAWIIFGVAAGAELVAIPLAKASLREAARQEAAREAVRVEQLD